MFHLKKCLSQTQVNRLWAVMGRNSALRIYAGAWLFLAKSLQCLRVHLSLLTCPPISLPLKLASSNEFSHCWKNCLCFAGSSRWDNFSFRTGSVSPKLCQGTAFPPAEHAILVALTVGNPLKSAKISPTNGNFMTQGTTSPGGRVCLQANYPPSTPKLLHSFNLPICRVV